MLIRFMADSHLTNRNLMKSEISIFIFCKTFLKGGAEKQALTLARLFTENGYRITLVNWSKNRIDPENLVFIEHYSIDYVGLGGNPFKKIRVLHGLTRRTNGPVILSYLTLANFVTGLLKLMNKRLITVGGIRTEQLPYMKMVSEKLVHNHLNTITVFNNYAAKLRLEARGFNPSRIHVIHNAIQVPELVKPPRGNEIITIITVTRFVRSKDLSTALYAYKRLVEDNPGRVLRYRILGYGYQEKAIRTLTRTLDLANNVELLIKPKGIFAKLKESDIYLSASKYEGLSNSIMEAMAAGLPVVATDVGDNIFLVADGFNGFLVKSGDVDAIVRKLQYLIDDQQAREVLGNHGHMKIASEFSEGRLFGSYIKLLSDLTGPKATEVDKL